ALRAARDRRVQQLRLLRLILEPGAPGPVAILDRVVDERELCGTDESGRAGRTQQAAGAEWIQVSGAAGVLPLFPRVTQAGHQIEIISEMPLAVREARCGLRVLIGGDQGAREEQILVPARNAGTHFILRVERSDDPVELL